MNGDGVAIVGSTQVGDPDVLWTAGVEGSAMGMRIACRHLRASWTCASGALDLDRATHRIDDAPAVETLRIIARHQSRCREGGPRV